MGHDKLRRPRRQVIKCCKYIKIHLKKVSLASIARKTKKFDRSLFFFLSLFFHRQKFFPV
uniref:Uncharacterized protein n=1 Tax=Anguilla anguilla TaxID=7936 RepID=A0A0E9XBT5_ANGAN